MLINAKLLYCAFHFVHKQQWFVELYGDTSCVFSPSATYPLHIVHMFMLKPLNEISSFWYLIEIGAENEHFNFTQ
jgi:hypothetical protein